MTTFNTIVQSVITANPFGCVAYMTACENHPAVEKTKEAYTVRIVYQDDDANTVGTGTHKFDSLAVFLLVQPPCSVLRPSRPHTGARPPMTPMATRIP